LKPIGSSIWKRREVSESPDRPLTTQTFSATSAGVHVHQGSDCTHTAEVICDQRSVTPMAQSTIKVH